MAWRALTYAKLTASPYSVRAGTDLGTPLNQPGLGRAIGWPDLTYTERVAFALERSLMITVYLYTGNDRYGKTRGSASPCAVLLFC